MQEEIAAKFDKQRLRAICFDVDGTLRDTDDQFVLRLCKLLNPLRSILRDSQPKQLARRIVMATENPGNTLMTLADRVGMDAVLGRMGEWFYRIGSAKSPSPAPMVNGTYQMLRLLKGEYDLAVVSSRSEQVTMDFLRQHDLLQFFKFIATSQTCRHTKPWPDPIRRAAQEMGVPVKACLMVGDTTVDILAGKACGAQTAGVLCGFGEEDELRKAGADLILKSTTDLSTVLFA